MIPEDTEKFRTSEILCRDCKYCKTKHIRRVAEYWISWCGLGPQSQGKRIGIRTELRKPHPKCPLKKRKEDVSNRRQQWKRKS